MPAVPATVVPGMPRSSPAVERSGVPKTSRVAAGGTSTASDMTHRTREDTRAAVGLAAPVDAVAIARSSAFERARAAATARSSDCALGEAETVARLRAPVPIGAVTVSRSRAAARARAGTCSGAATAAVSTFGSGTAAISRMVGGAAAASTLAGPASVSTRTLSCGAGVAGLSAGECDSSPNSANAENVVVLEEDERSAISCSESKNVSGSSRSTVCAPLKC